MKVKSYYFMLVLLLFGLTALAQEKAISGTVTDDGGLPLPGATVLIKGTTTGASTDFDGNYTINASQGQTLVYSFVGYANQEVVIGVSNTINVSLQEDTTTLEEVVVTAFGGTKQKRELGYATTIVKSEDLTEVTSVNPFETLSGKIAGVDITSPAQPGASTKIILRGFTSITGSNRPLIIVDGSPINGGQTSGTSAAVTRSFDTGTGLSDIDPNNIESINILKGGASAALYGSRAANGVILITTKKGKDSSKINFEVSTATDFTEVARIPHLQDSFGQGWSGASYSGGLASNENGSWGAPFNGEIRPWGQIANNSQQIKPYVALKDNIRDFYDIGTNFTNSIRFSGGTTASNYSFGFTNTDADGIIPTKADSFKRKALSFTGGIGSGKFSAKTSVNFIIRDQNAVNTGQGGNQGATLAQDLIQIPRDISVIDLKDYTNNIFNSNDYFYTPYATNPYWTINENSTNFKSNKLFGNINLSYQFNDELSVTFQTGMDVENQKTKSYGAIINYDPSLPVGSQGGTDVTGGVTENTFVRKEYDTFFQLAYDKQITDNLHLDASAGITFNQRSTDFLGVNITSLDIPNFYELSNTAERPQVTQINTLRRTYGVYSQATLGFMERYFLTLTARNDWSSTLPIENNSYFYPSANLSAVILDSNNAFLKLRSAVSKIANDTGPYRTKSTLVQGNGNAFFGNITFPFNGVNAFELAGQIGNPNLKPETTVEYEFGFESSLLNRRISLDVSVYKKETSDLLINRQLARTTGFTQITGNFASVENKGIELLLNIKPIRTENFLWDMSYTFTKNENEVTDLQGLDRLAINGAYGVTFNAELGKPLGVFRVNTPSKTATGQYIVNPATGYYTFDTQAEAGTSQRDFVMGLTNKLTYKGFSLSFAWDWKQGGKMYSYTSRLLEFTGNAIITTYNNRNPFIVPNSVVDNGDGTYSENTTPISFDNVTNFYNVGQNPGIEATQIIDKTFVRLRTLSLAYSPSSKFTEKLGLSKITLTLYGRNLFLWTPNENPYIDPEVSTFGSDLASEFGEFATNATERTYGTSLKISF